MKNEKILDLVISIVFAIIALFVAYITFGILNSTAELKGDNKYTYGGAIAGFIVSFILMYSAFKQLRNSSDKFSSVLQANKDLQKQNEELQQKLIRGAPHPSGFEIEVAERQKLVLARPQNWAPRGGVIFDFEDPENTEKDQFPARFQVVYTPNFEDIADQKEYYNNILESFKNNPFLGAYTSEIILLGGDSLGIRSLKIVSEAYVVSAEEKNEPIKKKNKRIWNFITKEEYEGIINRENNKDNSAKTTSTQNEKNNLVETGNRKTETIGFSHKKIYEFTVVCYQKDIGEKGTIFFLKFWDDDRDFTLMSETFNKILYSTRFLA